MRCWECITARDWHTRGCSGRHSDHAPSCHANTPVCLHTWVPKSQTEGELVPEQLHRVTVEARTPPQAKPLNSSSFSAGDLVHWRSSQLTVDEPTHARPKELADPRGYGETALLLVPSTFSPLLLRRGEGRRPPSRPRALHRSSPQPSPAAAGQSLPSDAPVPPCESPKARCT